MARSSSRFKISSLAAFRFAVACFTMSNKLAKALAAFSCLSKTMLVLTSSEVMVFRLLLEGAETLLEIRDIDGLKAEVSPPVGKL